MAHKASLEKDHFPANMLVEEHCSSGGGRHETIGEHNLSIVGGNWEGIIGDRLSR